MCFRVNNSIIQNGIIFSMNAIVCSPQKVKANEYKIYEGEFK